MQVSNIYYVNSFSKIAMNYAVILEYSHGSLPILMHQELKYSLRSLVLPYRFGGLIWVYDQFSNYDPLLSTVSWFYAGPNIKWDVLRALRF